MTGQPADAPEEDDAPRASSERLTQEELYSKFDDPEVDVPVHRAVSRLLGIESSHPSLPDDMPAIEKIKIYARTGFSYRCEGTDEDFERVWEQAFKKRSKYSDLVEALKEKGGN
jgi:hypothetical protein